MPRTPTMTVDDPADLLHPDTLDAIREDRADAAQQAADAALAAEFAPIEAFDDVRVPTDPDEPWWIRNGGLLPRQTRSGIPVEWLRSVRIELRQPIADEPKRDVAIEMLRAANGIPQATTSRLYATSETVRSHVDRIAADRQAHAHRPEQEERRAKDHQRRRAELARARRRRLKGRRARLQRIATDLIGSPELAGHVEEIARLVSGSGGLPDLTATERRAFVAACGALWTDLDDEATHLPDLPGDLTDWDDLLHDVDGDTGLLQRALADPDVAAAINDGQTPPDAVAEALATHGADAFVPVSDLPPDPWDDVRRLLEDDADLPGWMPTETASSLPVELLAKAPEPVRRPIAECSEDREARRLLCTYAGQIGSANYKLPLREGYLPAGTGVPQPPDAFADIDDELDGEESTG